MEQLSDDKLVRLASSPDLVEFAAWQSALEHANVPFRAHRGRFISVKMPNGMGEIWVLGDDLDLAKAVLSKLVPEDKEADLYFGW